MQTLAEVMSVYHRYHTKNSTKLTHFIGVPCIIFALQLLLCLSYAPLAWTAAFLLLAYYFLLDVSLALITALFLLPLTYAAQSCVQFSSTFAFILFCITFIAGWAVQLLGHYFEGNRPALTDNLLQIFVAPIFLAAELVFALGYRKELQQEVMMLADKPLAQ